MAKYVFKRILWMIPIILLVAVLVFTLLYFCPGDPCDLLLTEDATEEQRMALRHELGLDQGYFKRLSDFLSNTFIHFDLGTSYISKTDIAAEIRVRLPRTMLLGLLSMLIGVGVGVPLGIVAALKQNTGFDRGCMAFALFGVSMPSFWLALLLVLLFSVKLEWLPAYGIGSIKHYILPTLASCMAGIATQARQSRSSMLEVIRSDYVTTARSKGLSSMRVVLRHELPNALLPIITVAGSQFMVMFGGSLVIEQVFSIPGMGSLFSTSVMNRDYPVVLAGAVFMSIVSSVVMLLIDLLYAAADPRIKAQYAGSSRKKSKRGAKTV